MIDEKTVALEQMLDYYCDAETEHDRNLIGSCVNAMNYVIATLADGSFIAVPIGSIVRPFRPQASFKFAGTVSTSGKSA